MIELGLLEYICESFNVSRGSHPALGKFAAGKFAVGKFSAGKIRRGKTRRADFFIDLVKKIVNDYENFHFFYIFEG